MHTELILVGLVVSIQSSDSDEPAWLTNLKNDPNVPDSVKETYSNLGPGCQPLGPTGAALVQGRYADMEWKQVAGTFCDGASFSDGCRVFVNGNWWKNNPSSSCAGYCAAQPGDVKCTHAAEYKDNTCEADVKQSFQCTDTILNFEVRLSSEGRAEAVTCTCATDAELDAAGSDNSDAIVSSNPTSSTTVDGAVSAAASVVTVFTLTPMLL